MEGINKHTFDKTSIKTTAEIFKINLNDEPNLSFSDSKKEVVNSIINFEESIVQHISKINEPFKFFL